MSELFHRVCILTVQEVTDGTSVSIENPLTAFTMGYNRHFEKPSPIEPPLASKTNYRIAFSVQKDISSDANTAEIIVYNLSANSRSQLEKENLFVTLKAGYKNSVDIIFTGYITRTETAKQGADVLTKIYCSDGIKDIKEARISKTWKAGTPKSIVIADVLKTFKGAVLGEVTSRSLTDVLTGDFSVNDLSAKIMKDLEKQNPFEFSIQDNAVQILDYDVPSAKAVLLSAKTGLIGTPNKITIDDKKKPGEKNNGVKFQALLIPDLKIGGQAIINSAQIKGGYKLIKIAYTGDTHSAAWNADCEGVALL